MTRFVIIIIVIKLTYKNLSNPALANNSITIVV